jgi:hypothetical protein
MLLIRQDHKYFVIGVYVTIFVYYLIYAFSVVFVKDD